MKHEMMPRTGTVHTALWVGVCLWLGCTNGTSQLAGGGTDVSNGRIIGTLVLQGGLPANGTRLGLRPNRFDPLESQSQDSDSCLWTQTASNGTFSFDSVAPDTYVIEARSPDANRRCLLWDVIVSADETTTLATDSLRPCGALRLHLPLALQNDSGYIYLPGTRYFGSISPAGPDSGGVAIDSLPAGTLPALHYRALHSTTAIIDTSVYWIDANDTNEFEFDSDDSLEIDD